MSIINIDRLEELAGTAINQSAENMVGSPLESLTHLASLYAQINRLRSAERAIFRQMEAFNKTPHFYVPAIDELSPEERAISGI